jgi:ankyrin repeat protein
MLRGRGYSTDTYKTLQTAYFNQPTTYQQACYGAKVADVIRQGDVKTLRAMMLGGMSPNPCNVYGESLVHMTCRRGNDDLLRVLIAAGVNLQVSDDYGRTVRTLF